MRTVTLFPQPKSITVDPHADQINGPRLYVRVLVDADPMVFFTLNPAEAAKLMTAIMEGFGECRGPV
jgi:hypothetical protein